MLRFLVPLLALLALAGPAAALDALRTSKVPGNLPTLDCSPAAPGIAVNGADGKVFYCDNTGSQRTSTLLNALPAGRKAVEQGLGDDLGVPATQALGFSGTPTLFDWLWKLSGTGCVPITRYLTSAQLADVRARSLAVDVTAPLQTAITANACVDLEPGSYRVSTAFDLPNGNLLRGASRELTRIVSYNADASKPVVYVGGKSGLQDLALGFAPSLLTGSETQGQRVGVWLVSPSSTYAAQRGKVLSNVWIRDTGTPVYEPAGGASVFSASFRDLEITNFSYRGWDFGSSNRTGNIYDNIHITNTGSTFANVDRGFSLTGEESESTLLQINVERVTVNSAVTLDGMRGFYASAIHLEQVLNRTANSAMVYLNRSAGRIGTLTMFYLPIRTDGWIGLQVEDATYNGATANPTVLSSVQIDTYHVKGLNDSGQVGYTAGIGSIPNFYFVTRSAGAAGAMFVKIDNWVWNSFKADTAVYTAFPADPQGKIRFVAGVNSPTGRGASWYRDSAGFLHQWGVINAVHQVQNAITYPVACPTAIDTFMATDANTSFNATGPIGAAADANLTSAKITNKHATIDSFVYWRLLCH